MQRWISRYERVLCLSSPPVPEEGMAGERAEDIPGPAPDVGTALGPTLCLLYKTGHFLMWTSLGGKTENPTTHPKLKGDFWFCLCSTALKRRTLNGPRTPHTWLHKVQLLKTMAAVSCHRMPCSTAVASHHSSRQRAFYTERGNVDRCNHHGNQCGAYTVKETQKSVISFLGTLPKEAETSYYSAIYGSTVHKR